MNKIKNQLIGIGLSLAIGLTTIGAMSGSLSSYGEPPKKEAVEYIDIDTNKEIVRYELEAAELDLGLVSSKVSELELKFFQNELYDDNTDIDINTLVEKRSIQIQGLADQIYALKSALYDAQDNDAIQTLLEAVRCLKDDIYTLNISI